MFLASVWAQGYDPFNSLLLSALVALIPIIFFLVTLGVLGWRAYIAGFSTTLLAMILAIVVFKMPIPQAVMSGFNGLSGKRGRKSGNRL